MTLTNATITGGGIGIGIFGVSGVTVSNTTISGGGNSGLAIWGGTHGVIIDHVSVTTAPYANHVSYFIIRDDSCANRPTDIVVSNSDFHGGSQSVGWFGLEAKCAQNLTILNNSFEGGQVLVSLPDSNNVLIKGNSFSLPNTGAYWGVEIAHANDVVVDGNTFTGNSSQYAAAVEQNSGSLRATFRNNIVRSVYVGFDNPTSVFTFSGNSFSNVSCQTASNGNCIAPPATGSGGLHG